MSNTIRPTKKQRQTLDFISQFIAEHGYSPSYREIMNGCNYTSVATVALHVGNLIQRGHIRKRDRSARSLEVVKQTEVYEEAVIDVTPAEEKWLVNKIEHYFREVEQSSEVEQRRIDNLYVLIGALKVLGFEGASQAFISRLSALKINKDA